MRFFNALFLLARRCGGVAALAVAGALLAGCADTAYYAQSVGGHVRLMQAARPVDQWLADAHTPPALHARLQLAQRMRAFAVAELALPDNPSYHRYADLQRRAVVWNVVAAPPWSLTLKTWCFPVAGCVGYRGYFDEGQARAFAADLQNQGLEVSVYGVPAYSTLGWMNWLGGDPLLNTFIHYPEGELARMLFHELAHQVLYVPDDTRFNESFATAVERLGSAHWLALHGSDATRQAFARLEVQRQQFRALTRQTREALARVYAQNHAPALDGAAQEAIKSRAMQAFRADYAELRTRWLAEPGTAAASLSGFDAWVATANNASFGAQAAYDDLVPAFTALFAQQAQGLPAPQAWQRFYTEAKRLAALPADQRAQALAALMPNKETSGG